MVSSTCGQFGYGTFDHMRFGIGYIEDTIPETVLFSEENYFEIGVVIPEIVDFTESDTSLITATETESLGYLEFGVRYGTLCGRFGDVFGGMTFGCKAGNFIAELQSASTESIVFTESDTSLITATETESLGYLEFGVRYGTLCGRFGDVFGGMTFGCNFIAELQSASTESIVFTESNTTVLISDITEILNFIEDVILFINYMTVCVRLSCALPNNKPIYLTCALPNNKPVILECKLKC